MRTVEYVLKRDASKLPYLHAVRDLPEFPELRKPELVADFLNKFYDLSKLPEEHTILIGLNKDLSASGIFQLSHGSFDASLVDIRSVFIRLLLSGSAAFVIAHNHPSGKCSPSDEDVRLTSRLEEIGKILGCNLLDHVIVGDGYYSFQEANCIEKESK